MMSSPASAEAAKPKKEDGDDPVDSSSVTPKDNARPPPPGESKPRMALDKLGDEIQRKRIAKLFYSLDQNKDGILDPDELEKGLEKMGYAHVNKQQIQVRQQRSLESVLIEGNNCAKGCDINVYRALR